MKKTGTIITKTNLYKFDTFTEMVDFLSHNIGNRVIKWNETNYLTAAYSTDKHGNPVIEDKREAFFLEEFTDEDYELLNDANDCFTSLEEFFDKDGNPLDEEFADVFDMASFQGEEYINQ